MRRAVFCACRRVDEGGLGVESTEEKLRKYVGAVAGSLCNHLSLTNHENLGAETSAFVHA